MSDTLTVTVRPAQPDAGLALSQEQVIVLVVVAVICGVLAAILASASARLWPSWGRRRRVGLCALLAVLPIVLLPGLAFALMEGLPWTILWPAFTRFLVTAVLIGVVVCAPVAIWATRQPKPPDLPDIFE